MPTRRSQSQPTLSFPRRKSSRLGSRGKTATQLELQSDGDTKPGAPHQRVTIKPEEPSRPNLLPLSPRKRTGDENACNLPVSLLGSPPKQTCRTPTARSPRRLTFDENTPVFSSPSKDSLQSQCPSRRAQETPCPSPAKGSERVFKVRLFGGEESQYHSVKRALHTAVPQRLLSRAHERASIRCFLLEKVKARLPACLYISGPPGTGKTACLTSVLQEMEAELQSVQTIIINCMTLRSSHSLFRLLAESLGVTGGERKLDKLLTGCGPSVLLVLDEMDQLDSRAQDVLYTVFEWPFLPNSRLALIGIANALDLTDRILPRLQARPACKPQLLHFPPYSRQELADIVQDRIASAAGEALLDAAAVQFCARKVSAVSGDARKALDICRRAVEMVESDNRNKASTSASEPKTRRVSVPQVARVLADVYGDRMAAGGSEGGESFPLQQKLLVCCLLMLTRQGKSREVPLGKLHEVYSRLCAQRQVCSVGQAECLSLCSLLESCGIFTLKKAKEVRLTKVCLKIEEHDVEHALKDRALLGSILSSGLP